MTLKIGDIGGSGGGGGGITNPLSDNESLVFGTTNPSSITAEVNGVVNRTYLSVNNTTHFLIIGDEANKGYDFLGANPGIADPVIAITSHNQVKNEFAYMTVDSNERSFSIGASSGDPLDGTPTVANGVDFRFAAGDGGSLGGDGGDIRFKTGNGNFAGQKGGDFVFNISVGGAGGNGGLFKIQSDTPNPSWPIKLNGTGTFKILSNADDTKYLELSNNQTDSIFNTSSGGFRWNLAGVQKMGMDSSGRVGIGTPTPTQALDVVGNITLDGFVQGSTTTSITASVVQAQGQQPLTTELNEVSIVANANDVVTLPPASAGRHVSVINNGANDLQVYPAAGNDLGNGLNVSQTIAAGSGYHWDAYNSTVWWPGL